MTYYLKTKAGNVFPASTWKCRVAGCDSEMLCSHDEAPTEAAVHLGWKKLYKRQEPSRIDVKKDVVMVFDGFACHLHEVRDE